MRISQWLLALLACAVLFAPIAMAGGESSVMDDDDDDDEGGEGILGFDTEDLGDPARVLLALTTSIALWKPLFKWLRGPGIEKFNISDPRGFKKKLGKFNRQFMKVHTYLGLATAILGTVHGMGVEWHWTLWLAVLLMWALSITGGLMQWKWPPKEVRKGARLLHMQRAFSIIAIVLLIVGHIIVD